MREIHWPRDRNGMPKKMCPSLASRAHRIQRARVFQDSLSKKRRLIKVHPMDCSLRVKLNFSMVVLKCCRFRSNGHKMNEYHPRTF